MPRKILITGASIAGNTAAWWLTHYGFDVTVVEKAPEFRDGGQNITVRGAACHVLRKMKLDRAVADHWTGERGTAWVDEDNNTIAQFDADRCSSEGPDAKLEILRGDLARLLYEPAATRATYRFGESITSVEQGDGEGGSSVTFDSGRAEHFDVVIVAEGVGSSTRELLFDGNIRSRWMNLSVGYFTIPRGENDSCYWRIYNAKGGRCVSLRPDRLGTIRAYLSVHKMPEDEHKWSVDQQREFLQERFTDAGWEAPRVLKGMQVAEDFSFDVLRQVNMENWSRGGVVLTGDAAWCPTAISGVGTTLAIIGAYVLAGELSRSRTDNCREAFAAYERIMRPLVKDGQGVATIIPRMLNPHSRLGLALLRGVLRFVSMPGIRNFAPRGIVRNSRHFELPQY